MSKRFNLQYDRKTPKPSASPRTWSRWRLFRNISDVQDQKRELMINETRDTIQESKSGSKLSRQMQNLLGGLSVR